MPRILSNRYVLSDTPISGGMADVYKAFDTGQGATCAVKIFKGGDQDNAVMRESFRRETLALNELSHSNIVQFLDSGTDDLGQYFLVLEWVPHNLSERLAQTPFGGWDDFYERLGRPVLGALTFAHERRVIHRDLKPSNILITEDGQPKVADFGIAKMKTYVEPGITLAHFASVPFTPPEYDDGTFTYSRDVFSFGVLALRCLTEVDLRSHHDLGTALDELDAPEEVIEVITRAISIAPELRQKHAGILLTELEKIWESRNKGGEPKRVCHLRLSPKAHDNLKRQMGTTSERDVRDAVERDLNAVVGVRLRNDDGKGDRQESHYHLYGENYSYHVAVDRRDRDHLFVFNAWRHSAAQLERQREEAWIPSDKFTFKVATPRDAEAAKAAVQYLQQEADRRWQQLQMEARERADWKLLQSWESILRAKTELEKQRNYPLRYSGVHKEGYRAYIRLAEDPPEDLVGQPRVIRLPDGGLIRCEVESVRGQEITLYVMEGDLDLLPPSGKMEFDTRAADVALERQKFALDAVRFDRAVRPELRNLIAHPSAARVPEEAEDIEFVNQTLDDDQKTSVRKALASRDFLAVEGPPGTGKTTFIAELITQVFLKTPHARVLLTSQTHVALDNAIERIVKSSPDLKIIRVAGAIGAARVAVDSKKYLVASQMSKWREEVLASGRNFLREWAERNGIPADKASFGFTLKKLVSLRKDLRQKDDERIRLNDELTRVEGVEPDGVQLSVETRRQLLDDLEIDVARFDKERAELRRQIKEAEATLSRLDPYGEQLIAQPDEDISEWVSIYLPDTPAAKQLTELWEIHSDWENQFGRREEFEVALLANAQMIAGTCLGVAGIKGSQDITYDLCIVDEASKATPTEVLIPLSRSKRWVLVGDQKQLSPFQDPDLSSPAFRNKYDFTAEELNATLFDHLIETLPGECRAALTIQHRMVPPIGSLVSECFYDGRLQNATTTTDGTLSLVVPRPVTWFTTSANPSHSETPAGSSYVNQCEAAFIHRLVDRINWAAGLANRKYTVALISGYSSQRKELERRLDPDRSRWDNLNIDCNTVDAFQGREADIVIYSVTRSNAGGNMGFLKVPERLNVALSRGRLYLCIVGDHYFCETATGDNPFKTVVRHIEQHPEGCTIQRTDA